MRGLLVLGKWLGGIFWTYQTILPAIFAVIIVLFKFVSILISQGVMQAITYLGTQLFAAEFIINQNVKMAIENSPQYGINSFLEIVSSVILIYYMVKVITMVFVNFAGAQARWSASLLALVVVALLEMVVIKITQGTFAFVPIKDGLWFLAMNLGPVFNNIHILNFITQYVGNETAANSTQNLTDILSAGNATIQ